LDGQAIGHQAVQVHRPDATVGASSHGVEG